MTDRFDDELRDDPDDLDDLDDLDESGGAGTAARPAGSGPAAATRPTVGSPEGVRILGAEEAQAALGGGTARRPVGPPPGPVPASSSGDTTWSASGGDTVLPAAPRGSRRPTEPLAPASGAGGTTGEAGGRRATGEAGDADEVPPLPHWSEPPTGAMPAIFAETEDDAAGVGDIDAWASMTGGAPRFRAEGSDWAEADFGEGALTDERTRVGALAEEPEVDEHAEFEREVAARRRGSRGVAAAEAPPGSRTRRAGAGPREPEAPPAEPASERDLPTALLTAGIVACLALGAFSLGPAWTAALCAAIIGLAALELARTLQLKGFRPAAPLLLVASVGLVIAAREYGVSAYPVFFGLVAIASLVWYLWGVTPGRPVRDVAATMLVFGYVGGLGGFAGLLLTFGDDGIGLVLGVVICTVAYDVFGYFVGSQFGRQPVAPRISPNKTVGGTVGGMLASVAFGAVVVGGALGPGIFPWDGGSGLALGAAVGIGAFLGDLCESMLKRDLDIKDFGALLPGHGGVLDRFDAMLFCLPITYYLAIHFAPFG